MGASSLEQATDGALRADDAIGGGGVGELYLRANCGDRRVRELFDAIDAVLEAIAQTVAKRVQAIGESCVATVDTVEDTRAGTFRGRVNLVRGLHVVIMRCVSSVATVVNARAT